MSEAIIKHRPSRACQLRCGWGGGDEWLKCRSVLKSPRHTACLDTLRVLANHLGQIGGVTVHLFCIFGHSQRMGLTLGKSDSTQNTVKFVFHLGLQEIELVSRMLRIAI